jgi:hypothetical protein
MTARRKIPAMTRANRDKPVRPGMYLRLSKDHEQTGLGVARQGEDCGMLAAKLGWGTPTLYPGLRRSGGLDLSVRFGDALRCVQAQPW